MAKDRETKPYPASERKSPVGASAATQGTGRPDIAWRRFPEFEKLLESEKFEPVLERFEATCRQLDQLVTSGSAQEKSRARAAMAAYLRTLELLRQLTELKDKMASAGNQATSKSDRR